MLVRGFPFNSHHPFRLFPAFVRLSPRHFPVSFFTFSSGGFLTANGAKISFAIVRLPSLRYWCLFALSPAFSLSRTISK